MEKRALFCQILLRTASDYRTLISFGLFLEDSSHSSTLQIPENQTYATDNKLSSLHFEDSDIINIIRSLDTSKAHGHHDISIKMLKICDPAIIRPLSIIYRNCISQNAFPDMWKKSNICPIHQKSDK